MPQILREVARPVRRQLFSIMTASGLNLTVIGNLMSFLGLTDVNELNNYILHASVQVGNPGDMAGGDVVFLYLLPLGSINSVNVKLQSQDRNDQDGWMSLTNESTELQADFANWAALETHYALLDITIFRKSHIMKPPALMYGSS